MMIAKITAAYTRRYRDSGERVAYVEWIDDHGRTGWTEGRIGPCPHCVDRAEREGMTIAYQVL